MARLFPLRSETPSQEGQPRVVDLDGEDADAVFGALSSTTARRIYAHLNDEPGTPSDVADAIDSSIQNVRYHLEKLEDAGLIEVVDTWYSSRGNEMSVYATADGPLIVTSDTSRASKLRDALSRYLGGVAVLGGASLFLQYGLENLLSAMGADGAWFSGSEDDAPTDSSGDGGDRTDGNGGGETTDGLRIQEEDYVATDPDREDAHEESGDAPSDDASQTDSESLTTAADYLADANETVLGSLPPGLLFFLGGLLVLTVVSVWLYRSSY